MPTPPLSKNLARVRGYSCTAHACVNRIIAPRSMRARFLALFGVEKPGTSWAACVTAVDDMAPPGFLVSPES